MGILVGLNVIDCNLCVKEEDLDSQQGVIDFSLYLRSTSRSLDTNDNINHEHQSYNKRNVSQLDNKDNNGTATSSDNGDNHSTASGSTFDSNHGQGNMIAVLDQKNYIEELNRHLK